jgi:hypothetical protein
MACGTVVWRRAARGGSRYRGVVSHGTTTGRHPLGRDPSPTRVLQTTGLVVDQSGASCSADMALVCPSLDQDSDV